jgi:hypothetical protein
MNDLDAAAFTQLFKDAYKKCFGYPLQAAVTETESKLLSNQVLDETGLVIGFKSVKNYSAFIFNSDTAKPENPSISTLDTLSRYVLNAPYTDEAQRKKKESHYPYWFEYKDKFYRSLMPEPPAQTIKKRPLRLLAVSAVLALILLIWAGVLFVGGSKSHVSFTDNFHNVSVDSLVAKGWMVNSTDTAYWARRGQAAGSLTLFTLAGDNWPDSAHKPSISNLLLHRIDDDCFTTEVHLQKFVPHQNWQQAGILLMKDTGFYAKSMRLTIAYNDFFGGLPKNRQIIIQAITSLGSSFSKPEEIAHTSLFNLDTLTANPTLIHNLDHCALRIEKHGKKFRLLYAGGMLENGAFKEITSQEFDMQPKYVGIFALKGFVNNTETMPVNFTFFCLTGEKCNE